jgi:hypothetical protein
MPQAMDTRRVRNTLVAAASSATISTGPVGRIVDDVDLRPQRFRDGKFEHKRAGILDRGVQCTQRGGLGRLTRRRTIEDRLVGLEALARPYLHPTVHLM